MNDAMTGITGITGMDESKSEIPFGDIGSGKMPVKPYISEEHFEREKELIWRNNWIVAGRESEISGKNDFVVFDFGVLSTSILITRARDGELRAFHNICKHRGHKLCNEASGNQKSFVCSFHGWSYDPEGELRGVPWEETFREGVDRDDARLSEVAVDTWGGFIFIHVNPEPRHTLKEYLNGFPEPLEAYLRERDWQWFGGNANVVDYNWKLGMEGSECYHAGFLHSGTVSTPIAKEQVIYSLFNSPGVLSRESLHVPSDMTMMSEEGLEGMDIEAMMAEMRTPVELLAAKFSGLVNFSGLEIQDDVTSGYPGALNLDSNPAWLFDGYYLFPNMFIILQQNEFHLFHFWPVDVNTAIYHWDSYQIGKPENFGQLFGQMQKVVFAAEVALEDIYAGECMQSSFESGVIDSVYVCDGEVLVRAFQKKCVEGF